MVEMKVDMKCCHSTELDLRLYPPSPLEDPGAHKARWGRSTIALWLAQLPRGCVALCGETADFRALVRNVMVETNSLAVELGASFGVCSKIIAKRGFDLLGLDVSEKALDQARQDVPGARFECIDVLGDREGLNACITQALVQHERDGVSFICIDLGGNRKGSLRPIVDLILWCHEVISPPLIVVKSRGLWEDAVKYSAKLSGALDGWASAYLARDEPDRAEERRAKYQQAKQLERQQQPVSEAMLCRSYNDRGLCKLPCAWGWHHYCRACLVSGRGAQQHAECDCIRGTMDPANTEVEEHSSTA